MFIFKQPREIGNKNGRLWKITYRLRPDEIDAYTPDYVSPVTWIPNNVSGYAIDYEKTPCGNEYFLSITAVEDEYSS